MSLTSNHHHYSSTPYNRRKEKSFFFVVAMTSNLFFILLASTASATTSSQDPLGMGERPKMFVDYLHGPLRGEVKRFFGNSSLVDNFRIMRQDENFLLVAATDFVYFLDTRTMKEAKELRIEWKPDEQAKEMCSVKGKSKDECQNHIRVIAKLDKKLLLVCGTHAYKPKCRHYKFKEGRYVQEKEFSGVGLTPFDPYHNSSFVIAEGELYSATVSDFSASDPLIYKEPLRTEQSDSKHLNSPDFVKTLSDGDYVYFFFREQAVEYINCGKSVYSRVARVCKSDRGGPNKYKTSWTSFLKSRLNCSLPGEYPFYFDHLQSASEIVEGTYGGQPSRVIYAAFTTPQNSISGNAICAFRLRDLLDTFEGAFKEQESSNSNWLPVPKIKEPSPRPGRCSLDSKTLPETTLSFAKGHAIMDEAVPSFFGGRPLFVRANLQRTSQFRELTVDPQVRTSNGHTYDVLFVGTTRGRILKLANTVDPSRGARENSAPTLIEEIVAFPPEVTILDLKIVRNSLERAPKLIVLTKDAIAAIPLSRCKAAKTCSSCVALRDPYCAWDASRAVCASLHDHDRVDSASFVQNVDKGEHRQCGKDEGEDEGESREEPSSSQVLLDAKNEGKDDYSSSSSSDEEEDNNSFSILYGHEVDSSYTAEELSMAVATSCVCALVVGFITGFLLARRCSCSRQDENPYHVPYLNQTGYQDDQIYAKVDDMTYYPVNNLNNMLVSLPNSNNSTTGSGSGSGTAASGSRNAPPALPSMPPPNGPSPSSAATVASTAGNNSKTLSLHHSAMNPRHADFQAFGTVHRSQKIYL